MGEEDVMVLNGACGRVFGVLSLMHLHFGPKEALFRKF